MAISRSTTWLVAAASAVLCTSLRAQQGDQPGLQAGTLTLLSRDDAAADAAESRSDEAGANQHADGSWPAESHMNDARYGNAYTTALVVLTLGAPNELLPIFQR